MKAIVLAGGHATRLWPLTRDRAKPLLPLGEKPIIQYAMDDLVSMEAVDEILISTNARFAPDFEEFISEQGYGNVRILVEEHRREEEKVGSLGAILQVIEAEGEDDYLVIGGDNYPSFDLEAFAAFAREQDAVTIACHEVGTREEAKAFGVVAIDDDRKITGFAEKPDDPASNLVSTAFYYFPAEQLSLFDRYREEHGGGEALDEPGRLLEWGHEQVDMYAYAFEGAWHDIGTPENYLTALAAVTEGQIDNGDVADSEIGDDVWVLDGAVVRSSELENCIVFPDAVIRDCTLRGCIIDKAVTLDGVTLEDSVIGAYSRVR